MLNVDDQGWTLNRRVSFTLQYARSCYMHACFLLLWIKVLIELPSHTWETNIIQRTEVLLIEITVKKWNRIA